MREIHIKRIYEAQTREDGRRVLVDRLWPRGTKKDEAAIDVWAKEIAPSNDLRKRYHEEEISWEEFRKAYLAELGAAADAYQRFKASVHGDRLTLLTASKQPERSHAAVLREALLREDQALRGNGHGSLGFEPIRLRRANRVS